MKMSRHENGPTMSESCNRGGVGRGGKKRVFSCLLALLLCIPLLLSPLAPAGADETGSDALLLQARNTATELEAIQRAYWSFWLDGLESYVREPLVRPKPTWPEDIQRLKTDGYLPDEFDHTRFSVSEMPVSRDRDFKLNITLQLQ